MGAVDLSDPAADLHARWLPSDTAIAHAVALLAAEPNADVALIPMIQPGKIRGIWTTGQDVRTLPGVVILATNDDIGKAGVPGFTYARHYCHVIAGEYQAAVWKARRDATDVLVSPGTTAHAVVTRDGNASVFEDF